MSPSFNLYSLLRYLNLVHSLETHLRSQIAIRDLVFDVTTIALNMWRQCGFSPSTLVLSCQLSLQQRCIFRVIHFLSTARSLVGVVSVLQAFWCHLLFYFTSYVLNMFRTLIYPSSGACDYSVELPHWSIVLGSMCVGVSVWLGWSGIRVAGFSLQQNSRKLLMMDILMSETCWEHKKWNKIASDIKLVFYSSAITMMHGPIIIKVCMLWCTKKTPLNFFMV